MRHAWEQLHCLRQVLLMVGPPLQLPTPVHKQQQQASASLGHPSDGSSGQGYEGVAAGGGNAVAAVQLSSMPQHLEAQQQQQQQQQQGASAGGTMVRGVFSLQQLEQQWQQQVHLGSPSSSGCQERCGDWLATELEQQQPRQHDSVRGATIGGADGSGTSGAPQGVQHARAAAAGVTASSQAQQQQQQQQLPGYALEAVQGMVLSCMDRQALQTSAEAP
jgi:hypothetical protein